MFKKIGTIRVEVRLMLEMDVDEEDARGIIEEMDYDFKHPLIQATEIVSDNIEEKFLKPNLTNRNKEL